MKDVKLYEKVPPLKNNFSIKFMEYENAGWLIPHWHEHVELLYFVLGECECFCDGKKSFVKGGDLLVVNSTEVHAFTVKVPAVYYCIIIFPAFFGDINFSDMVIKNHVPNDPYIKECILRIKEHIKSSALGSDMLVKSYTYRLFAYLAQNYRDDSPNANERSLKTGRLEILQRVFSYIEANYNDRITTSQLAAMCYLSEGYFCRFFKKTTGRTVADYITEFRIKKAFIMLRNTNSAISDIATKTGFDDASYFARVFRKTVGMSPTQYRKQYR